MRKAVIWSAWLGCICLATGCGSSTNKYGGDFPKDFNSRSDEEKIAYMMEAVTPDSVARFITYASLGYIPDVTLKSVNVAYNYAYQHYQNQDENQTKFIVEFDNFQNALSLDDKMKIMKAAGQEDPMGLGLRLGLDYFEQLRDKKMSLKEVDDEIRSFRKACGNDTAMYVRFVKGFKAALNTDGGKSIDAKIYAKYRNLPEQL